VGTKPWHERVRVLIRGCEPIADRFVRMATPAGLPVCTALDLLIEGLRVSAPNGRR
jgi:hypothetical protein